jgi:hypothetical protein
MTSAGKDVRDAAGAAGMDWAIATACAAWVGVVTTSRVAGAGLDEAGATASAFLTGGEAAGFSTIGAERATVLGSGSVFRSAPGVFNSGSAMIILPFVVSTTVVEAYPGALTVRVRLLYVPGGRSR